MYHHHGIAIPLFSLHSNHSQGIGEYPDLLPLIDWCQSIGFDIIQLLPLNDTGLGTSPYNAISAFALNPLHLGLSSLPYLTEELHKELANSPLLKDQKRIDYAATREYKNQFLQRYDIIARSQILQDKAYIEFVQQSPWLKGYAVFKAIKGLFLWSDWENWSEEYSPSNLDSLAIRYKKEVEWQCILQFLCDQQMQAAKLYAHHRRVFLMGDIPILIARDSADVWLHRELFDLTHSAGAPPDALSSEGQNWGFPLYNWDAIAGNQFQWWIDRLQWASRYYQIYRIDHIVGFFRIWAIAHGQSNRQGSFIPADPTTWIQHGERILKIMLQNCCMLPIGEDLGVIPPEVRVCLNQLGISGTRVMRWERRWEEKEPVYIPLTDYPNMSMTTVATHDTETLQLWWQNHPEAAEYLARSKGWDYMSQLSKEHHQAILFDSHQTSSFFHINPLQEYLALIPNMTWPDLEDERINIPGIISDHNWSYKLRPSIEKMINSPGLTDLMQSMCTF